MARCHASPFSKAPPKLIIHLIGNSLGVILPQEVIGKLTVGEGGSITLTDGPD